ncbi:hypothetical protein TRVL_01015 [Trypanosoma vivax]|nr:hypothetical protein TRVL_01015 [Trypanosoma vivax]
MAKGGSMHAVGHDQVAVADGPLEQREYDAIIAQLKNIMLLASEEPPPGEDAASIASRLNVLQQALEAVEQRTKEKQMAAEVVRAAIFTKRQERHAQMAMQRIEEIKKKIEDKHKLAQQLQLERQYMFNQRSETLSSKMGLIREHAQNTMNEMLAKSEAERQRRERAVERVHEERAKAAQKHEERSQQRMKQNHESLVRQKKLIEARRRQQMMTLKDREAEMSRRQMEEDTKKAEQARMQAYRVASNRSNSSVSRARRRLVDASEHEHKSLISELREKEEQHRARYEEEQSMRQYELQKRAYKRKERQERQRRNYEEQLERRIKRGDEIIAKAHDKRLRGEKAEQLRQARENDAGTAFARAVEEHRARAEMIQQRRREHILKTNYLRWNERAANVMQHVRDVLNSDCLGLPSGRQVGFLPSISMFNVADAKKCDTTRHN